MPRRWCEEKTHLPLVFATTSWFHSSAARFHVQSGATKGKLPPIGTLCQHLHLGGSRYRRWPEQLPARAPAQQKMPWDGAPPLGKRRPGRPPATWLCCWCRGEVCRGPPAGLHSAALVCAGGLQRARWQLYPNHNGSWWVLLRQLYIFPIIGSMCGSILVDIARWWVVLKVRSIVFPLIPNKSRSYSCLQYLSTVPFGRKSCPSFCSFSRALAILRQRSS